jgi:hypothetical protein
MLAFTSMLECLSKYHAFAGVPSPAFGASPCRVKEARFFTSEALLAEREGVTQLTRVATLNAMMLGNTPVLLLLSLICCGAARKNAVPTLG